MSYTIDYSTIALEVDREAHALADTIEYLGEKKLKAINQLGFIIRTNTSLNEEEKLEQARYWLNFAGVRGYPQIVCAKLMLIQDLH